LSFELFAVPGMPEVTPELNLAASVCGCLEASGLGLRAGDVVVVASKVVAKSEGRVVDMTGVSPGRRARALARVVDRDARELEVMLQEGGHFMGAVSAAQLYRTTGSAYFGRTGSEARRAIERMPTILFFEKDGRLFTEAGIDASNVPGEETISLLPVDCHESARRLAGRFEEISGVRVGVVISDSEVRIMRRGSLDIGLGWWGVEEVRTEFGKEDRHGLPKFGGVDHIVDALCAACGVLMGQTDEGVPVVIVRGVPSRYLSLETPAAAGKTTVSEKRLPTSRLVLWGVMELFWSRFRWYMARLNPFV